MKINLCGKQFGEFMLHLTTLPQGSAQSRYCDTMNARYSVNTSTFQDLKERLNYTLSQMPPDAKRYKLFMLGEAIKEFQRRFPLITKFKQLRLCKSQTAKLKQILIDDTMQRKLDLDWVIDILSNFNEFQIQPVQVYRAKGNDLLFASWDGQHTAMVLYVVAVMILNDTDDVEIPVTIYEVSLKSEIRNNFVKGNSKEGKKLLDPIDLFMQMIYGVRLDGSDNALWIEAERKQQYLEHNGLFVTADKFGDTNQPGAISRLDEINKYSASVIKELAMYLGLSAQDQRAVDPKEAYIMGNWFAMDHDNREEYTEEDMFRLYHLFKTKFNADFTPSGPFWKLVETSYLKYKEKEKQVYVNLYGQDFADLHFKEPRLNKDWIQGGTYLWHLVKKNYKQGPIPAMSINTPFTPEV
jgi:hypothetical protein